MNANQETARTLPVLLQLTGVPVVIVGGGPVATRKAQTLRDAGATITLISPDLTPTLIALRDMNETLVVVGRRYDGVEDLQGARLVIAATDDAVINAQIAADARAVGAWVNVADTPHLSDWRSPAIGRAGDLTIAVDTGGASPGLSAKLRDHLMLMIQREPGWAGAAALLRALRPALRAAGDTRQRRAFLRALVAQAPALGTATPDDAARILQSARDAAGITLTDEQLASIRHDAALDT